MAITTLQTGAVTRQTTTSLPTGMTYDVNATQFPLQQGIPQNAPYTFRFCPAAPSANCIAVAQAAVAGGNFNLVTTQTPAQVPEPVVNPVYGAPFYSSVYSYIQTFPLTYQGKSILALDMERQVEITTNAITPNAITLTLQGYDYRWTPVTTSVTIGNGQDPGTFTFPNPVAGIVSITASAAAAGVNFSFGTNQNIGLPYLLLNAGQIVSMGSNFQNNPPIQPQLADQVTFGNSWRSLPPSATTLCRGMIETTNLIEDGTLPNGTYECYFTYFPYGGDSELSNLLLNGNLASLGQIQATVGATSAASRLANTITNFTTANYALPYLTSYDLTGVQYNSSWTNPNAYVGDAAFYNNVYLPAVVNT